MIRENVILRGGVNQSILVINVQMAPNLVKNANCNCDSSEPKMVCQQVSSRFLKIAIEGELTPNGGNSFHGLTIRFINQKTVLLNAIVCVYSRKSRSMYSLGRF